MEFSMLSWRCELFVFTEKDVFGIISEFARHGYAKYTDPIAGIQTVSAVDGVQSGVWGSLNGAPSNAAEVGGKVTGSRVQAALLCLSKLFFLSVSYLLTRYTKR
ncbi:unnamed protein product [Taenia asiatica]|uniref:Glycine--tRNA ligase n=1 Tax=Taenia asiatica TaxID=60517 RepID=A0A0R3WE59_TAEAS|nr:unnamed protein product [Taenia asiatica]